MARIVTKPVVTSPSAYMASPARGGDGGGGDDVDMEVDVDVDVDVDVEVDVHQEMLNKTPLSASSPSLTPTQADALSASALSTGYYKRYFKELRLLGRGAFGSVFLVSYDHIISAPH
jgi:hypothetical protein